MCLNSPLRFAVVGKHPKPYNLSPRIQVKRFKPPSSPRPKSNQTNLLYSPNVSSQGKRNGWRRPDSVCRREGGTSAGYGPLGRL